MSVEFLPDDHAGAEPDLPPPARRRRWWLPLAVLAIGAIVAVLARSRPGPTHGATPAHPPAATRVTTPTQATAPAGPPDPACRGVPDCTVRSGVPAPIRRLARAYLPPGARLRVRTVVAVDSLTLRDLLVARDVDAVAGSVTVLIRVRRGGPATRPIVPDPPGVGSLLLHRVNSGFVVRLQYLAPETVPPSLDRLRALIGDPRLAAS